MNIKSNSLWSQNTIGRLDFLVAMFLLRIAFDIGGNATYGSFWCLLVFGIYALAELTLVRARVRDFQGNVRRWTEFYGVGLAFGALLVLGTIQQMFAHPSDQFTHMNRFLDSMFNWLMLYPNVYLCIAKPHDGEYALDSECKTTLQRIPVRIRVTNFLYNCKPKN